MLNGKRFVLAKPGLATLLVFFGLSACAYSGPLLITSGSWNLQGSGSWTFSGDGFSASGFNDFIGLNHCGFCFAPFQLQDPLPFSSYAADGSLQIGANTYVFPNLTFMGGSPWATGQVFLSPQGTLPIVSGAGAYNVLYDIGGSFCVTNNPAVPPPFPPDLSNPACLSLQGRAIAHFTVVATSTPNAFFQPVPTIEILAAPEPGTVGAGMLSVLLILIATRRAKVQTPQSS